MYAHFCQTPHCDHKSCKKCTLYSDSVADDRLAMFEAGLKTMQEVNSSTTAAVGGAVTAGAGAVSASAAAAGPAIGQSAADVQREIEKLLEGGSLKRKADVLQPAPPAPMPPRPPVLMPVGFGGGGGGGPFGFGYLPAFQAGIFWQPPHPHLAANNQQLRPAPPPVNPPHRGRR